MVAAGRIRMSILFSPDDRPEPGEIVELHTSAGLRRPRDTARIRRMYEASPIVWTARDGNRLVGILRGWTDGAFDGYVCDLAVDAGYQRQGIGRELLNRCVAAHSAEVQWVLRASAVAERYYEHLGWQKIENGWYLTRES
jgi:ribosomal protein S18 acetylase RimI-like enzyme